MARISTPAWHGTCIARRIGIGGAVHATVARADLAGTRNYLYYLTQAPHEFFVLSKPGQPPGYGGRNGNLPWGDNVHDCPVHSAREQAFDCVLFQSLVHYRKDQHEKELPPRGRNNCARGICPRVVRRSRHHCGRLGARGMPVALRYDRRDSQAGRREQAAYRRMRAMKQTYASPLTRTR
jgi:hypothetical protein